MSKILELEKKLKRLAEQGVGGEKLNAAQKLQEICQKHKINLEELEDDKIIEAWFKVSSEQRKFFVQIVSSVLGKEFDTYGQWINGRKTKNLIGIRARPADLAEIEMKYHFYWRIYNEELRIFYRAFIHKHSLFANSPAREERDLSPKELEELKRVFTMADAMKDEGFRKQLSA
ncbi:MAG: hypothetical protein C0424_10475 [Sphingobacteriaceae bacterium]|nr:hypothetical protein [Sphingobacteriaceae bacterium]